MTHTDQGVTTVPEEAQANSAVVASAPRVVLVGPPGAGKSTIGRRIASALNLPIVDSDLLIEQAHGKACGEIFSELGEERFRELEAGCVAQALATGGVVSLGGGAVLTPSTRQLLQRHTVVWIDVTAEEGIRRTAGSTSRPVLQADDPAQHYRDLLATREPFYREVANYRVRTDSRPPQRVVAEVLSIIESTEE
ncbi:MULTISPECIES: shikimate kinase [unclassified Corynebacterium]|uniref:shikimate kinase n=1 Tax=unclassified Corynebacterium TaxID=2624378 RepID=UPI0009F70E0B|nr:MULTISPECIES: shikimate kinase [unclassified Corynebacterium]